jgi:phenylpropionate dioxygenase-like ring-hydroxylating dioxygenase large terminal subunit
MYLANRWYAAALSAEIGAQPFARKICGRDLVLFRTESGRLAALEDRCAHRHAPLSLGTVAGEAIQCGYHGLRFGADGACMHIPGQASIPPRARVEAFPALDRHGWVWLWLGEAARADPALIPDWPWFAHPGWRGFQLYFHVNAAAQLFVDNLLDLSHVAITHRNSIGAASAADAEAVLEVKAEDERVSGVRALKGVEPGPFIAAWGKFPGRIDRTSTFTWRPPSNMEIKAEFADAASAGRSGHKITIMVINPITPETATTAHFWIGWARDFALDDDALTERSKQENTQVIMEDVRVIEGQQRVLATRPGLAAVPINADAAVIAVHKALERLRAKDSLPRG